MKRNFYLLLASLFLGVVQVSAQQMVVYASNGNEIKFEELDYASCKITFSDGKMQFFVGGTIKNTMDIKGIQRISFYGLQSGIEAVVDEGSIVYSSDTEALLTNTHPGAFIVVYRIDGAPVLSHVQTIASSVISVAHLPAGVYVAVVGSETLKFVKK